MLDLLFLEFLFAKSINFYLLSVFGRFSPSKKKNVSMQNGKKRLLFSFSFVVFRHDYSSGFISFFYPFVNPPRRR